MRRSSIVFALATLAACSGPQNTTDSSPDGAVDSALPDREPMDSQPPTDAPMMSEDGASSPDADDASPMDAPMDDVAPDSADDAAPADVPAPFDAPTDSGVDTGTDTGVDTGVDTGADVPMFPVRITGRIRFLASGSVTVTFNGVAQTFNALPDAAPIAFDVGTPAPATRHTITVTGGSTTQTCSVRLPTPEPLAEPVVNGVEIRCALSHREVLTADAVRGIAIPGAAMPPQRHLTEMPEWRINQPDPVTVLLSTHIPWLDFQSTTTLGAFEVAFVDTMTGNVVGRSIVRRANGNTRAMHASSVTMVTLPPGPHLIRPTFRHFDVDATRGPVEIQFGTRPTQGITTASLGPRQLEFDGVLLDSLSTFDGASLGRWMPTDSEPAVLAGGSRTIPLAPATRPSLPGGAAMLYSFTGSPASGPVQWDILSDSTTLVRGAAFYDDAEMAHPLLTAQPFPIAATANITALLSRFSYRNNFGPADNTVVIRGALVTTSNGSLSFRTPLTPSELGAAAFRPGVRMFAQRAVGNASWASTNAPVANPIPTLTPITVTLAAPRRVYYFVRIGSIRVTSDGAIADITLTRRNMAAPFSPQTLTQISVSSSNGQNSQGAYLSTLVDLPAGTHVLEPLVRPVTSIGVIPATGITTAYPVVYTPEVTSATVPLGHVAAGALVLE